LPIQFSSNFFDIMGSKVTQGHWEWCYSCSGLAQASRTSKYHLVSLLVYRVKYTQKQPTDYNATINNKDFAPKTSPVSKLNKSCKYCYCCCWCKEQQNCYSNSIRLLSIHMSAVTLTYTVHLLAPRDHDSIVSEWVEFNVTINTL